MKKIELKNGIRAFLAPVEGTAATTVLVMTKVGSRYETEELNGASHFVEHMMFKGTNKLPTPSDISRALDAIGADFNAYTSKEYTGYYIKADSVHQKFAIETLYDMTFDSLYPVAEMDRERNVIIEEINMYEDTPVRHIDDLLEGAMFDGNSLSWEIAGSAETMKTMTRDAVIKYRDDHYTPSRMTIAVAGKVDDSVEVWLNDTFGNVKGDDASNGYSKFEGFKEYEIPPVNMQKKVTEQVHLGLGFPGVSYDDERAAAMSVLATLFGGSMSSRLFMSVREKGGLAYRIVSRHSAYEDTGILAILAGLDKSRLSEAMDRIFIEIDDLVKNGPTDEEMQRTKQFIRGHILLAIEDSASRAEWYAQKALFLESVKTPEERIAAIEAVTAEQ
ncbi:MAG TPA: pitrilysin family protein, partial [Patescibacteria group bacterium]|nr:pitrilysin family protein [Patescibacteria group bacterium]